MWIFNGLFQVNVCCHMLVESGWKFLWLTSALTRVQEAPGTGSAEMEASSLAHEELVWKLLVRRRKGFLFHNTDSSCEKCWFLIFIIISQRRFSWIDATYHQWAVNTRHHLLPGTIKWNKVCLIKMNWKQYIWHLYITHLFGVKYFCCNKNIQSVSKCTCPSFGSK